MIKRLRSVGARMVISHILVATLTTIVVWLFFLFLVTFFAPQSSAQDYVGYAALETGYWMANSPDGLPNPSSLGPGFALVVSPENVVQHSFGDTSCRAGKPLAECTPIVLKNLPGANEVTADGEKWAEVVLPLQNGDRTIIHYKMVQPQLTLNIPLLGLVSGNGPYVLVVASATTLLSIPVALLLGWLLVRPLMLRVKNVTRASQNFARGELATRVEDNYPDEVGELAHQFDDMAGALEHNVLVLRELVQRNAELTQVAEQAAIQAERMRLARELHDDITQRLFSLSLNSASLPVAIDRDPAKAIEQAQQLNSMAEQTLLELRSLLVELRPTPLETRDLRRALEEMCEEWSQLNNIPVECNVVLNGTRLPATVENEIYRVTQESLNNIARHAYAHTVQVSLVQGKRQIVLSTTDDGRGFEPQKVTVSNKFGLISMRERARAVGGNLAIESDTTRGTTIRMTLPVERED